MANFNDGSVPYGASPASITINSVTYVVESWSTQEAVEIIERRGATNVPNARVVTEAITEGSATLQLATITTPLPERGITFTAPFRGVTLCQWVVTDVGNTRSQAETSKVNIGFYKVINPV